MDINKVLIEGSLADIRATLDAKAISAIELVDFYLARIEAFNAKGPSLNAVRSIAAEARNEARRADREIGAGSSRGPLHGIPVLLKDNILSGDGMRASAGATALRDFVPKTEATLVKRLRAAGAIVLGKTNLTEFADYVSEVMPSAFSGAGGEVKNPHTGPYGRGQGSSVGSASAVAASLAPVAIGTETQNSIQTPAAVSSIVGFKPTVGLVSRHGVVPLVPSQDSPGPLARTVQDAALMMSVLAGPDVRDAAGLAFPALQDFSGTRPLAGLRIGVPRRTIVDRPDIASVMPAFERMLSVLSRAGACIVDPCDLPSAEQIRDVRSSVFPTEFKAALNEFLAAHEPCGIDSLQRLIAWNEAHPEAIPYGQSLLQAAQATNGLDTATYRQDRHRDMVLSRVAGIHAALSLGVDLLIAPMGTLAKCTGKAGSPVLTIPLGLDEANAPVGVTLLGAIGGDADLLRAGAAIAGLVADRRLPSLGA